MMSDTSSIPSKKPLSDSQKTYLQFIRLGNSPSAEWLPQTIDWESIEALAERQGLSGVWLWALSSDAFGNGCVL